MINNLKGKTIGVFEVIDDSGERRQPSGMVLWKVKCKECGNIKLLTAPHIRRFRSCGCKTRDLQSAALRKSLNRGGYEEIFATHWTSIKKNSLSRNLPFEVDAKYAWELFINQTRKCALTGVHLQFPTRCWSKDGNASLDRIDSDKGYIRDNLQWVHKNINMMKQQYSTELFFDWCKKVVEYNHLGS